MRFSAAPNADEYVNKGSGRGFVQQGCLSRRFGQREDARRLWGPTSSIGIGQQKNPSLACLATWAETNGSTNWTGPTTEFCYKAISSAIAWMWPCGAQPKRRIHKSEVTTSRCLRTWAAAEFAVAPMTLFASCYQLLRCEVTNTLQFGEVALHAYLCQELLRAEAPSTSDGRVVAHMLSHRDGRPGEEAVDAGMVAVPIFPGHGSGLFAALGVCWPSLVSCQSLELLARPAARNHQLRFSQGEDLLRTLSGESKVHTPDVRCNFGVGQTALRSKSWKESWKDLEWIPESFKSLFLTLSMLVATELPQLTNQSWEPRGSLGANILAGAETWAGSRLRHSLYPTNGSCTEHTDYGVLTLQQSTGPGLEALIGGAWQSSKEKQLMCNVHGRSNIIFLQPDNNTLVQPLALYVLGNGQDLAAVRYGDWHRKKTSLAFRQP
ncbi:NCS1 [Symbiodinium sp. CCMP2592]|nr:NCS1 [Symbiodinium sp. CCMP2592]